VLLGVELLDELEEPEPEPPQPPPPPPPVFPEELPELTVAIIMNLLVDFVAILYLYRYYLVGVVDVFDEVVEGGRKKA
jgi:hypothetical protein